MAERSVPVTPTQVWDHSNGLTLYQVWTGYRVATRLYYAARKESNSCRKAPACSGSEETFVPLLWDCTCATAFWNELIGHWTGQAVTRQSTCALFGAWPVDEFTTFPSTEQKF